METPYENADIRYVEEEMLKLKASKMSSDKEHVKTLLRLRKSMLDNWAHAHEKELLPVVKQFNLAVERALKDLYDLAHRYYDYISNFDCGIQLEAHLRFTNSYPGLHPYQSSDRFRIWKALLEYGWNPLYEQGLIPSPLLFPYDVKKSFPLFAGTHEETSIAYWRGGGFYESAQADEMEKYHFNQVFDHLAEHTCFALTDFIYVREFETSIDIHWDDRKSYSRLED